MQFNVIDNKNKLLKSIEIDSPDDNKIDSELKTMFNASNVAHMLFTFKDNINFAELFDNDNNCKSITIKLK